MASGRRLEPYVDVPRRTTTDIITYKPLIHKWHDKHREVLCLLYKFYQNDTQDYAEIFSTLFRDQLQAEGFTTGLPKGRLVSRWMSMKDWDGGHDTWARIHLRHTHAEARRRYRHELGAIEDAARDLGISLSLRTQDHYGVSVHSRNLGKRARKIKHCRDSLSDITSFGGDTDTDEEPPTKLLQTRPADETPGSPSMRLSNHIPRMPRSAPAGGTCPNTAEDLSWTARTGGQISSLVRRVDDDGNKAPRMPCLVYRFWDPDLNLHSVNSSIGFRAGMFKDPTQPVTGIPEPDQLAALALNHLTLAPEQASPSPFISFFDSLRPTLYRALQRAAVAAPSSAGQYIAIVDLRKVEKSLKKRFPDANQVLYPVSCLVKDFNMKLAGDYRGPTEWLVWAVVEREAVVATFNVRQLMKSPICNQGLSDILQLKIFQQSLSMAEVHKKLRVLASPMLFGTVLQFISVPDQYKELVAAKIANAWMFRGYEDAKRTFRYADYMNGVYTTCGSVRGESVGIDDNSEDDIEVSEDLANDLGPVDDPEEALIVDGSKTTERESNFKIDTVRVEQINEGEEELIDQQIELECPEILASYQLATTNTQSDAALADPKDLWEDEPKDSPCPIREPSLDTFARELYEVAQECIPAPLAISNTPRVTDWTRWESVTPQMPPISSTTNDTVTAKVIIMDLTGDSDEGLSVDSGKETGRQVTRKPVTTSGRQGKNSNGDGIVKATEQRRKVLKKGRSRQGKDDGDELRIIDQVDFSEE